jgi:hypothetical protein
MRDILLGHDRRTSQPVRIPVKAFQTHFHLIGGTGKGKTTAIHTMLHPLLMEPFDKACYIIVDRMGNLSHELLLWMASRYCTQGVRDRLVYIEPAREGVVLGFNPLLYRTAGEGYYKVQRATEIILRAWESVNIEAMPRLARWTFNAFWAAAQLGLTIADCVHFLMPGSPHHTQLLNCLPDRLKYEWGELIDARSSEVVRILESTRNRLKPYFESDILRCMFGSTQSRLDVLRFMREGRIVLLNLSPQNRLSTQLADAIGALVLNEVLATARSLPLGIRYPTYLLLDEFQNFVGPDIESALPEVRQLGLRLILSHQSLSQLKRGDYDLTSMIFQAQSRMIFGIQGEDADLLGHELASITYDPKRIKEEQYVRRQRLSGHRIMELSSWSESQGEAANWNRTYGQNWGTHENLTHNQTRDARGELASRGQSEGQGSSRGGSEGQGSGGSSNRSTSHGTRQQLVPVHEDYEELASRTFYAFDEQKHLRASDLRNLPTGSCLLRLVDDPTLYEVSVKRSAPGHLAWDSETLVHRYPKAIEERDRLIEENFRSGLFVSPEAIEAETRQRIEAVLRPAIMIQARAAEEVPSPPPPEANPFA